MGGKEEENTGRLANEDSSLVRSFVRRQSGATSLPPPPSAAAAAAPH